MTARVSLVLALVCLSAPPAAAQGTPAASPAPAAAPPAEVPARVAIPIAEVLPRADTALTLLRELEGVAAPDAGVQEIAGGMEAASEDLIAQAFDTRRRLESLRSLDALRGLETGWRRRQEQLAEWAARCGKRAAALDSAYAETSAIRETWRATETAARKEGDTPRALLARIDEVQSATTQARKTLSTERLALLELQEKISREQERISGLLAELGETRLALERELLVRESLPLWTALGDVREREPLGASAERVLEEQIAELGAVWPPAAGVWLGVLLIAAISLWVVLGFRGRAARLAAEDPTFEPTARLFDRPYSAAAILAALVMRLVWGGQLPSLAEEIVRTLLLVPALRLLGQVVGPAARRPVFALAVFFVVDRVRVLLEEAALVDRLVFLGEMGAACAVLSWLLRPARLSELPAGVGGLAQVGWGLRLALGLCATALALNLVGYARLAFVLGDGALRSLFIAVGFYASYRVADGIVAAARRAWPLNLIRALRQRPFAAHQRTRNVLRAVAFAGWGLVSLETFTIRDEVTAGVRALLGARLELGELSLSLGNVLAFGLTIWLAMLFSRAVRYLLDEDVFPRMRLPRGVPAAISASIQYAAALLAFFLALAATGIDLTRFTILAGAFGVGVGFGLQNVVNGFVSGLILLYERPVQVGDIVQIADVQGTMRRIGIRSSTVRTFEGAEVIVPNASLIADRVVNWTLSDRLRRIELDVGVEYGNDPRRVLDLLVGVARAHPSVLDEPAPVALFNRFGASSLDFQLRAWTENVDDAMVVRSDLGVAIFDALHAAGIEIPYPTYDVRLQGRPTPP
jgi:small-conductance mechanosensitive channel